MFNIQKFSVIEPTQRRWRTSKPHLGFIQPSTQSVKGLYVQRKKE